MLPTQKNDEAEDGNQRRRGLNYLSEYYVPEGVHAKLNELFLDDRQSDLCTAVFSADVNADKQVIKDADKQAFTDADKQAIMQRIAITDSIDEAYKELRKILKETPAGLGLDNCHKQLKAGLIQGRMIRNKLDTVWNWTYAITYLLPKAVSGWMLMDTSWEMSFGFGFRAIPKSALNDPAKPLSPLFTLSTAPVQNPSLTFVSSSAIGKGLKETYKWWQPKYFTGLGDRREDIATVAETFRANSEQVAKALADGAAAEALVRAYGKDGSKFLRYLINKVDHCFYKYMEALQRSTWPMPVDKQLAETGVTEASVQLTYALLEQAAFIHAFTGRTQDRQAVLEYLQLGPAYPGADIVLWAKDPNVDDMRPSPNALHDDRAKAGFDSLTFWDYNRSLSGTLAYLESKADAGIDSHSLSRELEYLGGQADKDSSGAIDWQQVKWDVSAAKQGDRDSMFRLGELCEKDLLGMEGAEANRTAKQLYFPAADRGDVEAQYRLGRLYADERFTGRLESGNDSVAVEWLLEAAEKGHSQARMDLRRILDRIYANGRIDLKNPETAHLTQAWCERAVEAQVRSPEILFTLAQVYEKGLLLEQPDDDSAALAKKWYTEAAKEGHVKAQRKLGLQFLSDPVKNKDAEAAELLQMSAEQGDLKALYHRGKMYGSGRAQPPEGLTVQEAAADCFEHAADSGLALAQYELALMHLKGHAGLQPGPKADAKAVELLTKAAAQGLKEAQYELARMHLEGRAGLPVGQEANAKAVELLAKAAAQGLKEAQYELALMLLEGFTGLPVDPRTDAKAAELLTKAAAQGLKKAQYELAIMHLEGRAGLAVGPRADAKAVELLTKAAAQGLKEAQYELAIMHLKGRAGLAVGPRADAKATELLTKAAAQGLKEAQYELAIMHLEGRTGLPVGPKANPKAAELLTKAVEKGLNDAQCERALILLKGHAGLPVGQEANAKVAELLQYELALIHLEGRAGLPVGPKADAKAAQLLTEAAANGLEEAQYELARMHLEGRAGLPIGPEADEEAAELLMKAAEKGLEEAQYELAIMHLEGRAGLAVGARADAKAMELLTKAMEKGLNDAQYKRALKLLKDRAGLPADPKAGEKAEELLYYELAIMYLEGRASLPVGPKADAKAAELLTKAASKGLKEAQYELARMLLDGRAGLPAGPETDAKAAEQKRRDEAKRLLAQAQEQGHARARYQYGLMLLEDASSNTDNQTTDIKKQVSELRKKARGLIESAADEGDADLQYEASILYLNSKSSGQSENWRRMLTERAETWLKMAAEKGHTASMKKLVELYIDEQQPEAAETWLTKAGEKGDSDTESTIKVARLYIDKQTKLDREQPEQAKQVGLLEKAASLLEAVDLRAQNEGREDVSSINLLGWVYERMYRANELDSYKGYAIACYRRAADKGDDYASSRLKDLT